ncbi:MAG: 50S ribosome-binding GTPase [Candidatus Contendobacter sp.]|nr:50S ribosome-binding GTPase [Candidatus Contendobacter sp.]
MNEQTVVYSQELDNLAKHVQILFGTRDAEGFRTLISETKNDIERLSKRAGSVPIVGFFGPKDHGKSTLVKLLFKKQSDVEDIPSGYGSDGQTREVSWYGSSSPMGLDTNFERYRRAETTSQTWIEKDVIIGDIPGYSDADSFARNAAEHALKSCQLAILVITPDQYERSEIWREWHKSYGAALLPVINKCPPNFNQKEIIQYFKEESEKLGKEQILPPVFVPDCKNKFNQEFDEGKEGQKLAQRICDALARIEPGEITDRIENRMNKFRDNFRRRLDNKISNIKAPMRMYNEKFSGLPQLLADRVGGDQETILSTIQLTVLRQVLYKTSPIWFPYRPFLMLLALIRGATLSFTLGILGRLPSLALSAFQAFRNLKKISIADAEISQRLEQRCEHIILDELREPLNILHNRFQELEKGPIAAKKADLLSFNLLSFKVIGIDPLLDYSKEQYARLAQKYTPSLLWLQVTALLGTALFWVLIAGPLNAMYGEYLITSWKSFQAGESLTFKAFQTVELSKFIAAIILSSVPVFLFGMAMLWSFTQAKRLRYCAYEIIDGLKDELKKRLNNGSLCVQSNDIKLNTLQEMIRLGFVDIKEDSTKSLPVTSVTIK